MIKNWRLKNRIALGWAWDGEVVGEVIAQLACEP